MVETGRFLIGKQLYGSPWVFCYFRDVQLFIQYVFICMFFVDVVIQGMFFFLFFLVEKFKKPTTFCVDSGLTIN